LRIAAFVSSSRPAVQRRQMRLRQAWKMPAIARVTVGNYREEKRRRRARSSVRWRLMCGRMRKVQVSAACNFRAHTRLGERRVTPSDREPDGINLIGNAPTLHRHVDHRPICASFDICPTDLISVYTTPPATSRTSACVASSTKTTLMTVMNGAGENTSLYRHNSSRS
jgi:hypothetical protein